MIMELKEQLQRAFDEIPFYKGYTEALLFGETDFESGQSFDSLNYTLADFSLKALQEMKSDCDDFVAANNVALSRAYTTGKGYDAHQAGMDFYYTRVGHGVGFWDRGLGELGKVLADAARVYGGLTAEINDRGQIDVR